VGVGDDETVGTDEKAATGGRLYIFDGVTTGGAGFLIDSRSGLILARMGGMFSIREASAVEPVGGWRPGSADQGESDLVSSGRLLFSWGRLCKDVIVGFFPIMRLSFKS
jgi:hypothetical protein